MDSYYYPPLSRSLQESFKTTNLLIYNLSTKIFKQDYLPHYTHIG